MPDVANILPFNTCKSELQYLNLFWNSSVLIEISSPILPKLIAMATSFEESEKEVRIDKFQTNTFHLMKKIVKIGKVDPEIFWLKLQKEEINANKIYSPFGGHVELAKIWSFALWRQ